MSYPTQKTGHLRNTKPKIEKLQNMISENRNTKFCQFLCLTFVLLLFLGSNMTHEYFYDFRINYDHTKSPFYETAIKSGRVNLKFIIQLNSWEFKNFTSLKNLNSVGLNAENPIGGGSFNFWMTFVFLCLCYPIIFFMLLFSFKNINLFQIDFLNNVNQLFSIRSFPWSLYLLFATIYFLFRLPLNLLVLSHTQYDFYKINCMLIILYCFFKILNPTYTRIKSIVNPNHIVLFKDQTTLKERKKIYSELYSLGNLRFFCSSFCWNFLYIIMISFCQLCFLYFFQDSFLSNYIYTGDFYLNKLEIKDYKFLKHHCLMFLFLLSFIDWTFVSVRIALVKGWSMGFQGLYTNNQNLLDINLDLSKKIELTFGKNKKTTSFFIMKFYFLFVKIFRECITIVST
jgi:hypothetical protein